MLSLEERLDLIKQVGEEIIGEEELKKLLQNDQSLVAYDGFEPSGQIHIAQGLLRTININKITSAGIRFKMLVADWHAQANNKLGGDLEKIQTVGKYFIEIWKACGLNLSKVEFFWASEIVKKPEYWNLVINIGRTNKLARFIRTAEFMGREESAEKLTAAQIIYPCMQIADVFMLGAKITQLGMDQRKVNMLAREIGLQLGFYKPVVVSHHMLMGLGKPPSANANRTTRTVQNKMSKSNPDNAIFMTDSLEDITRKINKAYCPEGQTDENPVLEYCRYIIFESFSRLNTNGFIINRPAKFGGTVKFNTYADLEKSFGNKELHPQDLKQAVINYLNQLLEPVRKHFETNQDANTLLNKVKSLTTRKF